MSFSREQLGAMISTLETTAWTRASAQPQDPYLEENTEAEALAILQAASPEDRSYVRERMQRLLLGLHTRP